MVFKCPKVGYISNISFTVVPLVIPLNISFECILVEPKLGSFTISILFERITQFAFEPLDKVI